MTKFNAISVSGYHMLEAGAPPYLELAFTLADGYEYLEYGKKAGLDIDLFAPNVSFFLELVWIQNEIAKLRAAAFYGMVNNPRRWQKKNRNYYAHCQTSGWSLTKQRNENNTRTVIEALAATLGGTQSLHTNSMDEAISFAYDQETAAIAKRNSTLLAN